MHVAIGKVVQSAACPRYDEEHFHLYVTMEAVCHAPQRIPLQQAVTWIFHPSRPDAQPLFKSLKESEHDLDRFLVSGARHKARYKLSVDVLRAAYILWLQGAARDAEWRESIISTKNPDVWNARSKIVTTLDDDPKLQPLRDGSPRSPPRWSTEEKGAGTVIRRYRI